MPEWLLYTLGIAPWIPVVAFWIRRYRERRLRVRVMGLTAAIATFIGLGVPLGVGRLIRKSGLVDPETLLTILTTSVMVGLAVFSWWPILGKGLAKRGISW